MDSIREFKNFIQSWRSITIVVIVISVRGIRDSKGEKKLLIINEKCEFHQNVFALGNNFITKYEQLLNVYNGGHCGMVLIKNVTTTTKGDRYLRAQHYIIITKFVDETTKVRFLQLHNKLSSAQFTFKEVHSYPFLCII
jgi:hypothetical protein